MNKGKAFTLIELLIVVAIIAILALIAVPNLLQAQIRAKVVTVRADFRNLLVAMQAYRVDYNAYPDDIPRPGIDGEGTWLHDFYPLTHLTTPVAYITTVPTNPFFDLWSSGPSRGKGNYLYWGSDMHPPILPIFFHLASAGPDQTISGAGGQEGWRVIGRDPKFVNALYDPTNGTVSNGDLICHDRGLVF